MKGISTAAGAAASPGATTHRPAVEALLEGAEHDAETGDAAEAKQLEYHDKSSNGGSGSGIGSSGGDGSGSSGTCTSSHISMSRGGTGSASETGLSEAEYGPLESNDDARLSATEPVLKN